jgi:hypothetical protein
VPSLFNVLELHVSINNIEPICFAMETKERFPFAAFSSYGLLCAAVHNTNLLRSLCKVSNVFVKL